MIKLNSEATKLRTCCLPSVLLVFPLPDKKLSPNGRVAWKEKQTLTKAARQSAYLHCMALPRHIRSGLKLPFEHATVEATFFWPEKTKAGRNDNTRRDPCNAEASTKAIFDGFKDAGIITDDDYVHMRHLPPVFGKSDQPRLVIEIWDTSSVEVLS